MRKWIWALGLAVALNVAACTPKADKAASPKAIAGGTLRIYNWSDYIDPGLLKQFTEFRERADTFTLGVCNGCQLMALLGKSIIRLSNYLNVVSCSTL